MKFSLIRYSGTAEPGKNDVGETIATYEFGLGLTQPYVKYVLADNRDNAYAALEAKKATLDEETYNASYKTLIKLVGEYKVTYLSDGFKKEEYQSSAFETAYKDTFSKFYLDTENNTQTLITSLDTFADQFVNEVLAVDVVVAVYKVGIIDKKDTEIWRRTYRANVQ